MNKIIAISVWGNNPRYSVGAIRNAELAKELFPDWKVRIYHDTEVNSIHIEELKNFQNVELIDFSPLSNIIAPCFWRFYSLFESKDNITLIRDSDSRLSKREQKYVNNWLISDEKYFIIRDHVRHYDFPMLAGMWGYKGHMQTSFYDNMIKYAKNNFYTVDQIYLREVIWEEASQNSYIIGILENEEFKESRPNILPHFVGQGYDENDQPIYPIE